MILYFIIDTDEYLRGPEWPWHWIIGPYRHGLALVEASTLRYARQYSALQSTTGSHASQLSSQAACSLENFWKQID